MKLKAAATFRASELGGSLLDRGFKSRFVSQLDVDFSNFQDHCQARSESTERVSPVAIIVRVASIEA